MKIAIILGSFSVGARPLDFENLFTDKRGLTGTDLATIRIYQELTKLGNEVQLFTIYTSISDKYKIRPLEDYRKIDQENFDAVINFNEPNLFADIKKPYKILYMMLNDFSFLNAECLNEVDHFVAVCQQHMDYLIKQYPSTKDKWSYIELGCDPDLYSDQRIPGRVLWCSSADRGLHWLLQDWSKIKENVPEASLHICYDFNFDQLKNIEKHHMSPQGTPYHKNIVEMANRIRYIEHAIKELAHLDVVHLGSCSKEKMIQEWNQACVFGFCCDTVAFSEGFSVATLESHASYTVPVITDTDCLGSIYQKSGCILIKKSEINQKYSHNLISVLKNKRKQNKIIKQCRQFANNLTWTKTTQKLLQLINK